MSYFTEVHFFIKCPHHVTVVEPEWLGVRINIVLLASHIFSCLLRRWTSCWVSAMWTESACKQSTVWCVLSQCQAQRAIEPNQKALIEVTTMNLQKRSGTRELPIFGEGHKLLQVQIGERSKWLYLFSLFLPWLTWEAEWLKSLHTEPYTFQTAYGSKLSEDLGCGVLCVFSH